MPFEVLQTGRSPDQQALEGPLPLSEATKLAGAIASPLLGCSSLG